MNLLISNNSKNIYEILNINNQNLSKEISFLYDKFCKNINNNDEQRKKEDHNIYNNKTIKPNNINNKEELIYNTVNYEINTDNDIIDKNLLEIELMEEPKPQIYSLLKLDSNNLINNSYNAEIKGKNKDDIKDEIKVIKKTNKNNKDSKIKKRRFLSNNSIIYSVKDSGFKDDKSNLNLDNSSEIDYYNEIKNDEQIEEEKGIKRKSKELNLKENNNCKYHRFYIIAKNKNKKKKIELKKIFYHKNKDNENFDKSTNNKFKNLNCISKGLIEKIKYDINKEENSHHIYNKIQINFSNNKSKINIKNYLDDYFIPCKSPYKEELFLIKPENILINKLQKEILEKHLKDYFSSNFNSNKYNKSPYASKINNYQNFTNKKIFPLKISNICKHKNINSARTIYKSKSLSNENDFISFLPSSLQAPFDIFIKNIQKFKVRNRNNILLKDKEKSTIENYKKINKLYTTNFKSPKLLIKKSS